VKVYLGVDPTTGKERQKWIGGFRSEKEARAHLMVVATSPLYGSGLGPYGSSRLRLGDYLRDWLAHCQVSEGEMISRRARCRLHIIPYLGHVPLARVAPATLERFFSVQVPHLHPTMAHKVFGDLRAAFNRAVKLGLVASNPCLAIDPPRPRPYRPVVWKAEELQRFLATCQQGGEVGLLFTTAFASGARQGELLGAQWRYVDLERGILFVVQDLERPAGGGFRFGEVKTEHARRPVRLPVAIIMALRALRRRQVEERLRRGPCAQNSQCREAHCPFWHEHDLVFCQPNGKPLHGRNLTRRALKRLCHAAGVPAIRFHDLRHMHNTVLMGAGVSAKIVKERSGHSTVAFTLDRYSWVQPDMQEMAAEALGKTLAATGMLPD
jgi:integrase